MRYHHSQVVRFGLLRPALGIKPLSGGRFLHLGFIGGVSDLGGGAHLGLCHQRLLRFFEPAVHGCPHSYVHLRLLCPRLLDLLHLDIPLALVDDLIGSLPRLVNLLHHL